MISCENIFCIYEENGECVLRAPSLDFQGGCRECIYVDVPEEYLQSMKRAMLKKLDDILE